MIEGRPFLYQANDGTVYHINENGVEAIRSNRSWHPEEHIVAFVDGDKEGYQPAHMLTVNERIQIILASSPKGTGGMWTKQARSVKKLATKLWSPRELFIAGSVFGLLLSTLD